MCLLSHIIISNNVIGRFGPEVLIVFFKTLALLWDVLPIIANGFMNTQSSLNSFFSLALA